MTRRLLAVILTLTLLTGCAFASGVETLPAGDFLLPVERLPQDSLSAIPIRTADDFRAIFSAPDKAYVLMNDIELTSWDADESKVFSGILFGNGHSITYGTSGKMAEDGVLEQGLFHTLDGAFIENLQVHARIENACKGLENGRVYLGGLAAHAKGDVMLTTCTVEAQISMSTVQWLDQARTGVAAQSSPDASALAGMGANTGVGGFFGMVDPGAKLYMQYCRSQGSMTGVVNVGGMIGKGEGTTVDLLACENLADVTALVRAGGLIGSVPAQRDGHCALTFSANQGRVWALTSHAGGLLGYGSGSISIQDCINAGVVVAGALTAAGAKAGQIAGETEGEIKRVLLAGAVLPSAAESAEAAEPSELDTVYVWGRHPELGIDYPLALLGQKVNIYYAAYVQGMRDLLASNKEQSIRYYVERVNPAEGLGDAYRAQGIIPGTLSEANELWNWMEIANRFLDFDLRAVDDISLYDVLLTDLLLTPYMQTAYTSFSEANIIDAAVEILGWSVEKGAGTYLTASNAILDVDIAKKEKEIRELEKQIAELSNALRGNSADDMLDASLEAATVNRTTSIQDKNILEAAGGKLNKVGNVLSIGGTALSTLSVYMSGMETAAAEAAALDIYNATSAQLNHVFDAMLESEAAVSPNEEKKADKALDIASMKLAIRNLQAEAVKKNASDLQYDSEKTGSNLLNALAVPALTIAENTPIAKKLLGANFALYKSAFSVGMFFGNIIGNTDSAYYGCMLNSAAYASELLEATVQEYLHTFQENGTYEDAVRFRDALSLYVSLQALTIDYALTYDDSTTPVNAENRLDELQKKVEAIDRLKLIKSDMLTILELIASLP